MVIFLQILLSALSALLPWLLDLLKSGKPLPPKAKAKFEEALPLMKQLTSAAHALGCRHTEDAVTLESMPHDARLAGISALAQSGMADDE